MSRRRLARNAHGRSSPLGRQGESNLRCPSHDDTCTAHCGTRRCHCSALGMYRYHRPRQSTQQRTSKHPKCTRRDRGALRIPMPPPQAHDQGMCRPRMRVAATQCRSGRFLESKLHAQSTSYTHMRPRSSRLRPSRDCRRSVKASRAGAGHGLSTAISLAAAPNLQRWSAQPAAVTRQGWPE